MMYLYFLSIFDPMISEFLYSLAPGRFEWNYMNNFQEKMQDMQHMPLFHYLTQNDG